ncbi:MAG: sulfotransferase [bacterium]
MGPDFIGIGAQRAGTSWIYACLYEHPEVCAPRKELHFFSRDRNWSKGRDWYEKQFKECSSNQTIGEWSTSYLTEAHTAQRIREYYPDVRITVSMRNPVDRAFSQYKNDIMDGQLNPETSFEEALESDKKYVEMSRYKQHLERYFERFDEEQIGLFIYEDGKNDPETFIRSIYDFLGVNDRFTPSMLHEQVNPGRAPRFNSLERCLNKTSEWFQNSSLLRPFWWFAKKSGLGTLLRGANTQKEAVQPPKPNTRSRLRETFQADIEYVSQKTGHSLTQWKEANENKTNHIHGSQT